MNMAQMNPAMLNPNFIQQMMEQNQRGQNQGNQQFKRPEPGHHGQSSYQDQKEEQFDFCISKKINEELSIVEKTIPPVNGIKVKMPFINFTRLQGYESMLNNETSKNKLKFMMDTIYNRKQIKKTLDLRKLSDLERKRSLESWKMAPDKIIKQKINIRRLKLRVKKRQQAEQKKANFGGSSHQYKCPVYKCKFSAKTEDELIAHYEDTHADLVKLGMKLTKSDEARKQQKKKIVINPTGEGKSDKESESSFSVYGNDDESDSSNDSKNSEMEDLYELEKIEMSKRKDKRQNRGRP